MRATLSIEAAAAALLLIDLQEEQRQVPHYAVAGFEVVLANAQCLLAAARLRGLPVIHTAYRRAFDACPPPPLEPRMPDGTPFFSAKNSPRIPLFPEVPPPPGDRKGCGKGKRG